VSTAGLIFKSKTELDINKLIKTLFNIKIHKIEHPDQMDFDVRYIGNIMLERYEDIYVISNDELIWDHLVDINKTPEFLYECLGKPELFIGFCNYPSGGSYGYTVVQNGEKVRTKLIATTVPETNVDEGEPFPEELDWINSEYKFDEIEGEDKEFWPKYYYKKNDPENFAYENDLIQYMLNDLIKSRFGFIPWLSDKKPEYHFFLTKNAELKNPTSNKYKHLNNSWFNNVINMFKNN